jgi:hypothetical protein
VDLIQKIHYKDINEDFLTYIGELGFIEYVNKDHIFVTDINRLNILQLTLDEDKTSS